MKHQLIMLDNPIIVSDEEIKESDWAIETVTFINHNNLKPKEISDFNKEHPNTPFLKIIAGIPELPQIDWNNLEEEFGYVDVEKVFPVNRKGSMWMPNVDEVANQYRQEGFKKAQELNDNKFSLGDLKKFFDEGCLYGFESEEKQKGHFHWLVSKLSQPKIFDIEIEMEIWNHEGNLTSLSTIRPKVTNGKIKIIKKCKS